jgi:hypothetical protein
MSEEEKNSIREQHAGGMKVMIENFSKLVNSKLGDSKPLVSEQSENLLSRTFIKEQRTEEEKKKYAQDAMARHYAEDPLDKESNRKLRQETDPSKTLLFQEIRKDDFLAVIKKNSREDDDVFLAHVLNVWDQGNGVKGVEIEISRGHPNHPEGNYIGNFSGQLNEKTMEFGDYKIIQNLIHHSDEDDKSKEMSKGSPENIKQNTRPIRKPPVASPPPVTTPEKNKYNGKTVNLFSNPQETMFVFQIKILEEKVVGEYVNFTFESKFSGPGDKTLRFSCDGKLIFTDNPSKQYYNKKFIDSLKTNFCSAKVGTPPKSDFAP